jgi:hypothetical protein
LTTHVTLCFSAQRHLILDRSKEAYFLRIWNITEKPMKKIVILMALMTSFSAFAANYNIPGQANLIRMDLSEFGGPVEDALALGGDVAKGLYEGMSNPVETRTYTNTCTNKNGKTLEVEVTQRTGVTFGCEKWPAQCWGKLYYKCESTLDLKTGSAKARQTN